MLPQNEYDLLRRLSKSPGGTDSAQFRTRYEPVVRACLNRHAVLPMPALDFVNQVFAEFYALLARLYLPEQPGQGIPSVGAMLTSIAEQLALILQCGQSGLTGIPSPEHPEQSAIWHALQARYEAAVAADAADALEVDSLPLHYQPDVTRGVLLSIANSHKLVASGKILGFRLQQATVTLGTEKIRDLIGVQLELLRFRLREPAVTHRVSEMVGKCVTNLIHHRIKTTPHRRNWWKQEQEDLIQEVYLRLADKFGNPGETLYAGLSTFIYGTAKNTMYDWQRKYKPAPEAYEAGNGPDEDDTGFDPLVGDNVHDTGDISWQQYEELYERARVHLDQGYLHALELHYLKNCDLRTIGELIGKNANAVGTYLYRGMQALKTQICKEAKTRQLELTICYGKG